MLCLPWMIYAFIHFVKFLCVTQSFCPLGKSEHMGRVINIPSALQDNIVFEIVVCLYFYLNFFFKLKMNVVASTFTDVACGTLQFI